MQFMTSKRKKRNPKKTAWNRMMMMRGAIVFSVAKGFCGFVSEFSPFVRSLSLVILF